MDKKDYKDRKAFYFFIGCMLLSVVIIGATFAYFVASANSGNTISGGTYLTDLSLSVERVTTYDLVKGLIPMDNKQAPHAAEQLCHDDNDHAGCQIYKITVSTKSEDESFINSYLSLTNKDGVETRFSRVYPVEVDDNETGGKKTIYRTLYTKADFDDDEFDVDAVIKDGQFQNNGSVYENMNSEDDYNCLLAENEPIGGDNKTIDIYVMIWVYDNGENQDNLMGMEFAYTGMAVVNTDHGSEIKATFD